MNKKIENLFVIGTDTGVGKTVLSLLIMQYLFSRGYDPFYLKPVQTGCVDPYDVESDAAFIYNHVPQLKGKDPADSVVYCFRNPKAPLFAARNENKTIDLTLIEKKVAKQSLLHNPLVLEGAGGILVPVKKNIMIADLIKLAEAKPVIAARAGLGTINHTLLTIEGLKSRGITPLAVVLIDSGEKPTEPEMIEENKEAIEETSGVMVAGIIGRIQDYSLPNLEFYLPIMHILKMLKQA